MLAKAGESDRAIRVKMVVVFYIYSFVVLALFRSVGSPPFLFPPGADDTHHFHAFLIFSRNTSSPGSGRRARLTADRYVGMAMIPVYSIWPPSGALTHVSLFFIPVSWHEYRIYHTHIYTHHERLHECKRRMTVRQLPGSCIRTSNALRRKQQSNQNQHRSCNSTESNRNKNTSLEPTTSTVVVLSNN